MTDQRGPDEPHPKKERSVLGRRQVLLAGGATAATLGLGAAAGVASAGEESANAGKAAGSSAGSSRAAVCSLTKEVTEGPYWLDGALVRSDLTEDKEGLALTVELTVVDEANDCAPLADALVELWHADALGEYSGYVGENGHDEPDNGTFLRGGVLTDENGVATLTTIYPGWYMGRCVHIHVKVHTDVELTDDGSYSGGEEIHTGQLFFDESVTEEVGATSPYSDNDTERVTLDDDGIYDGGGATSGLVELAEASDGYKASLTLGVDSTA